MRRAPRNGQFHVQLSVYLFKIIKTHENVFSPNISYQMAPGNFKFNDCAHITDCSKTSRYSLKKCSCFSTKVQRGAVDGIQSQSALIKQRETGSESLWALSVPFKCAPQCAFKIPDRNHKTADSMRRAYCY